MAKSVIEKQRKGKTFQKVFFAMVISIIFLITLTLITLTLLGVNVFEEAEKYASKVPGLSEVTSSQEAAETTEDQDRLQATIANKEAEIEQLQSEVENKQSTIDEMDQQILQLQAELEDAIDIKENTGENESALDLAESFQEMDAKEAAPIIENMSQTLAVEVLREVASEERGNILGQMDPEMAAEIVSVLLDS